jgi:hypothetical protein
MQPDVVEAIKHWSLTGLLEKLVKIGVKIVTLVRYRVDTDSASSRLVSWRVNSGYQGLYS